MEFLRKFEENSDDFSFITAFLLPCKKFVEQSDELFGSALIGERSKSTNIGEQNAEIFEIKYLKPVILWLNSGFN